MTIFHGVIIGAVQGIAEWLPVSSKGLTTLLLVNLYSLPFKDAYMFAVWLHMGTLVAAVSYFRRELMDIFRAIPGYIRNFREISLTERGKLISFLILGTAATAVIGGPLILFNLENLQIGGPVLTAIIGLFLIITGLVQRFARGVQSGVEKPVKAMDGVWVGLAQALSAFPGFSRSGMSVSALLLLRYESRQSLRLCFLLSVPIILLAEVGLAIYSRFTVSEATVAGMLSAAVFGFLTIGALMRVALVVPFWIFCVALGALSFVPLITGIYSL